MKRLQNLAPSCRSLKGSWRAQATIILSVRLFSNFVLVGFVGWVVARESMAACVNDREWPLLPHAKNASCGEDCDTL